MSAPFAATTRLLAPTRMKGARGPQTIAEVLRRNDLTRRSVERRKKQKESKYRSDYERDRRREISSLKKLSSDIVREARKVRKEDYELGPLAPRRDVGEHFESYGTVSRQILQTIDVPEWKRQWCPFQVGDRVVVMEGRDKGKISVVEFVYDEAEVLQLKDINLVEVAVPEWMRKAQGTTQPVSTYNTKIPYDGVRLVFPLAHPVTGEKRDVIIENLERRVDWVDEETGETHYKRVVPELDEYEIPWPPQEEPVYTDHEDDTLRVQVEQETFAGQSVALFGLPMPESVIDELRNKHSKIGKIRDLSYIEKIQDREQEKRQKDLDMLMAMRTPLQELHALRKEQKKQQLGTNPEPDEAMRFNETYLDIQKDKPWTRKISYDAKRAWKKAWAEEKEAAKREGRAAKKPLTNVVQHEALDPAFLEQLGAMMEQKGLDGTKKAATRMTAS